MYVSVLTPSGGKGRKKIPLELLDSIAWSMLSILHEATERKGKERREGVSCLDLGA